MTPPHLGEIIKGLCLEPLGLTVTDSEGPGVTRKALSEPLNGHAGVSPEMAMQLEQAFGGTAETWLKMQRKARGQPEGDALCEPGCVPRLWGRARGRSQAMHRNTVTPSARPQRRGPHRRLGDQVMNDAL